jgi:hypothetical protein
VVDWVLVFYQCLPEDFIYFNYLKGPNVFAIKYDLATSEELLMVMGSERKLKAARVVSLIASTLISLSCGTIVGHTTRRINSKLNCWIVCLFGLGARFRRETEALVDSK